MPVVQQVSLALGQGELACLLGPSGCGKTTTLRMVAGFVRPDSGRILIAGNDVTDAPPYRRDTGMVFQSYALFPHMTVSENVAFGLESIGVARPERLARVAEMLAMVELPHLAHRRPRELSGGQQQRVALARALALRPAVLLLDEPFSNLDARLRARMQLEVQALIRRVAITTLFVTHDQTEAMSIADRLIVMNAGRIQQTGTPAQVYGSPQSRFVAEFMGVCSLVPGEVSGGVFRTGAGLAARADRQDGPATAVIRPENVHLASGDRAALVRVIGRSYQGATARLQLAAGDQPIAMDVPGHLGLEVGDMISVTIDADTITFLPDERPSVRQ